MDEAERQPFLDRLSQFNAERGQPLSSVPTISKQPLDLFRLYKSVKNRGGYKEVSRAKQWKDVAQDCQITISSSAAYTLKKQYTKLILPFECKFDRGGIPVDVMIADTEQSSRKGSKKSKASVAPSPGPSDSNSQGSYPQSGTPGSVDHGSNGSYPPPHPSPTGSPYPSGGTHPGYGPPPGHPSSAPSPYGPPYPGQQGPNNSYYGHPGLHPRVGPGGPPPHAQPGPGAGHYGQQQQYPGYGPPPQSGGYGPPPPSSYNGYNGYGPPPGHPSGSGGTGQHPSDPQQQQQPHPGGYGPPPGTMPGPGQHHSNGMPPHPQQQQQQMHPGHWGQPQPPSAAAGAGIPPSSSPANSRPGSGHSVSVQDPFSDDQHQQQPGGGPPGPYQQRPGGPQQPPTSQQQHPGAPGGASSQPPVGPPGSGPPQTHSQQHSQQPNGPGGGPPPPGHPAARGGPLPPPSGGKPMPPQLQSPNDRPGGGPPTGPPQMQGPPGHHPGDHRMGYGGPPPQQPPMKKPDGSYVQQPQYPGYGPHSAAAGPYGQQQPPQNSYGQLQHPGQQQHPGRSGPTPPHQQQQTQQYGQHPQQHPQYPGYGPSGPGGYGPPPPGSYNGYNGYPPGPPSGHQQGQPQQQQSQPQPSQHAGEPHPGYGPPPQHASNGMPPQHPQQQHPGHWGPPGAASGQPHKYGPPPPSSAAPPPQQAGPASRPGSGGHSVSAQDPFADEQQQQSQPPQQGPYRGPPQQPNVNPQQGPGGPPATSQAPPGPPQQQRPPQMPPQHPQHPGHQQQQGPPMGPGGYGPPTGSPYPGHGGPRGPPPQMPPHHQGHYPTRTSSPLQRLLAKPSQPPPVGGPQNGHQGPPGHHHPAMRMGYGPPPLRAESGPYPPPPVGPHHPPGSAMKKPPPPSPNSHHPPGPPPMHHHMSQGPHHPGMGGMPPGMQPGQMMPSGQMMQSGSMPQHLPGGPPPPGFYGGPPPQQMKKELNFPPNIVEGTLPKLIKRRRLTSKDVSQIEPFRLLMCLKSGMLAESTWALDVLSILVHDDNTVLYFGLQNLPGLLDVLLEHYVKYLSEIFEGLFDDQQALDEVSDGYKNCLSKYRVRLKARPTRKWYEIEKDLIEPAAPTTTTTPGNQQPTGNKSSNGDLVNCDNNLNKKVNGDVAGIGSVVITPPNNIPKSVADQPPIVLLNGPINFTLRSRDGKPVTIDQKATPLTVSRALLELDELRAWDLLSDSNTTDSGFHEEEDDTSHILTQFESKEKFVRFARVLKEKNISSITTAATTVAEKSKEPETPEALRDEKPVAESNKQPTGTDNVNNSIPVIKEEPMQVDNDQPAVASTSDNEYPCFRSPKRKHIAMAELEDEVQHRHDTPLHPVDAYCDSLVRRCQCLSTLIRNLSFVPGNDVDMSKHKGLLMILSRLLLLNHDHGIRKRTVTRPVTSLTDTESLFNEEPADGEAENKPTAETDADNNSCDLFEACDRDWHWDALHLVLENTLVTLSNISGQLNISPYPEKITLPLLDGLLHWSVCPSAYARDHLPTTSLSTVSPQRLALETLVKLSIIEDNVDLILATPPWDRLDRFFRQLSKTLSRNEDQTMREFALVLLGNLSAADTGIARAIALTGNAIPQLISFIEETEQSALSVANQRGIHALRENPELMGTTLDMVRRAALSLKWMARIPENRPLFMNFQQRLLQLVMSQILDQGVAAIVADVIYEISLSEPPLANGTPFFPIIDLKDLLEKRANRASTEAKEKADSEAAAAAAVATDQEEESAPPKSDKAASIVADENNGKPTAVEVNNITEIKQTC